MLCCGCHRHKDGSLLQAGGSKVGRAGTRDVLHGSGLLSSNSTEIIFNKELTPENGLFLSKLIYVCVKNYAMTSCLLEPLFARKKKVPLSFPSSQVLNSVGKISKSNSRFQIIFFPI